MSIYSSWVHREHLPVNRHISVYERAKNVIVACLRGPMISVTKGKRHRFPDQFRRLVSIHSDGVVYPCQEDSHVGDIDEGRNEAVLLSNESCRGLSPGTHHNCDDGKETQVHESISSPRINSSYGVVYHCQEDSHVEDIDEGRNEAVDVVEPLDQETTDSLPLFIEATTEKLLRNKEGKVLGGSFCGPVSRPCGSNIEKVIEKLYSLEPENGFLVRDVKGYEWCPGCDAGDGRMYAVTVAKPPGPQLLTVNLFREQKFQDWTNIALTCELRLLRYCGYKNLSAKLSAL